jgi:thymidylate synthase
MEALWMLAGRNDVAWPAYFAKQIGQYSDDGETLHGAYGKRWRSYFGYDQLDWIMLGLECNPESRREVLTMWDPGSLDDNDEPRECTGDLYVGGHGGKDVPCNTHAYFDLRGGVLNMTVMQRSGDALWGVYGANAVHMSILQEYVAAGIGAPVGVYRQFCNNFHVYPANLDDTKFLPEEGPHERIRQLAVDADIHDYYKQGKVKPFPLVNTDIKTWDADLKLFLRHPTGNGFYKDVFFQSVAFPMYMAWNMRKDKRGTGLEWARLIAAPDWRRACVEWIVRREARKEKTA